MVFIVLNYVTCIPVLLAVGGFRLVTLNALYSVPSDAALFSSIYHFYSLLSNSTTIEGWEKDRVATMVRRGRIREVRVVFP